MDTVKLVRICFCPNKLLDFIDKSNDNIAKRLWYLPKNRKEVLYLAMAARKFVRKENKEKALRKRKKIKKS